MDVWCDIIISQRVAVFDRFGSTRRYSSCQQLDDGRAFVDPVHTAGAIEPCNERCYHLDRDSVVNRCDLSLHGAELLVQ